MATNYTAEKLSLFVAEQFNESFYEPEPTSIGYVFIGNHIPYADENVTPEINESEQTEKSVWDSMFAAKRITGTDINLVLPLNEWASGVYNQYDDRNPSTQNIYIVDSSSRRVYKCLSNNNGTVSTVLPSSDYTVNNGLISTSDGYIWKYMFQYPESSKFITTNYIPVPTSSNTSGYNTSYSSLVEGGIHRIMVTNVGSNYNHPVIRSVNFGPNKNTITMSSVSGIANNMIVTGTGVLSNTLVSDINVGTSTIKLSRNTSTTTTATATNSLTFSTRVVITGDGTGAVATAIRTAASNTITGVRVTNTGTNYTRGNVVFQGSGTGANARIIFTPKYGHGYNPAKELGAKSVMIAIQMGGSDTTEGGLISPDTTFRQYGFLKDPHKYGNTAPLNSLTANSVISQLHEITLTVGSPYTINEFVYQGTDATNSTFSGVVNSQTSSVIKLSRVKGSFTLGETVKGTLSSVSRNAIKIVYPEFEPYTGDILFVKNVAKVQRVYEQAEVLKFVLTF